MVAYWSSRKSSRAPVSGFLGHWVAKLRTRSGTRLLVVLRGCSSRAMTPERASFVLQC